MFWIRLRSSAIIVIVALITLYFGGICTALVVMGVSLIGFFELLRVYKLEKSPMAIAGYSVTIIYYLLLYFGYHELIMPLLIVYLLVLLGIYVFGFPKYNTENIIVPFFSFFYVCVMLSYIFLVRNMNNGGLLVALIFICSWGNDTCAYCVGISIGKHKMTPKLSPKKSIEGAIGGILGAALIGFIYGFIISKVYFIDINIQIIFPIVGGIGALSAIVGDLAASAIKRNHDVKDYGKLMPGHGGILDRFDSVITTAPIVYYLIYFVTEWNIFK